MTAPTNYERAGGQEAFEKMTEVFYAKVLKDDLLGDLFRDMSSEHSKHVARFLSEVLGGPKRYTGESQKSHAHMISRHVGRKLDETQRQRWIQLVLESADEIGMPNDAEFRAALVPDAPPRSTPTPRSPRPAPGAASVRARRHGASAACGRRAT